MNKDLLIHI
jgi:RNA recognition motif-containing protein